MQKLSDYANQTMDTETEERHVKHSKLASNTAV